MDPVTAIAHAIGGATNLASGIIDYSQKKKLAGKTRQYGDKLDKYYSGLQKSAEQSDFADTAYGKYLERASSEGVYSQATEQGMLGRVARTAESGAQEARQEYLGALAARGMTGSIASARGLAEIKGKKSEILSDASLDIRMSEEENMAKAREALARSSTEHDLTMQDRADQYGLKALESKYGLELDALGLKATGATSLAGGIAGGIGAVAQGAAVGKSLNRQNELWAKALTASKNGDDSLLRLLFEQKGE